MGELNALNGERIQGFVRLELYDKYGNVKPINKHNMITPAGKALMMQMSAAALLGMNDTFYGAYAKQGASMVTWIDGSSTPTKKYDRNSAITNVLLNLSPEQKSGINSETRFVNIFDNSFTNPERVVGYANMSLQPAANGKEGTLDYQKGEDVISKVIYSKKFRYADGVATGTINAIAMMPYCAINTPYGASGYADQYAPGFRMAKLLDKVNTRNTNFVALSTAFCPPGVEGVTSESEVIANYNIDGNTQHRINLVTGEVTDIVNGDTSIPMITSEMQDYYIEGDYLYLLSRNGSGTIPTSLLTVYQMSTKTQVEAITLNTRYSYFQRFLVIDGVLYINGISSNLTGDTLFKLTKGSKGYWSAIDTSAPDYSGLFTIPSGLNPYTVCFGNYGDKYVMYIARIQSAETANRLYASAYIFTDLTDIAGSIVDCIPSVRYSDIVFKNASVGGVLSIGIERNYSAQTDSIYQVSVTVDDGSVKKETEMEAAGLFYSVEGNWSNMISIAVLPDSDVVEKGATDVLYVTYGYKLV